MRQSRPKPPGYQTHYVQKMSKESFQRTPCGIHVPKAFRTEDKDEVTCAVCGRVYVPGLEEATP